MYGGDEVGSLVFDIGSFNSRFGYSGEDTPRYVFESHIGVSQIQSNDDVIMDNKEVKYFFGENELRYYKPGIIVNNPINSQGYVENFNLLEKLVENVYNKCFRTESKDHPILLSEPVLHNKDNRLNIAQLLFEKFDIPALFITKSPVLSAFSSGRSTCLVLDSGHNYTSATPINDGYALQKSLIRYNIGGEYISNELRNVLKSKEIDIVPHYKFIKEFNTERGCYITKYLSPEETVSDISYENFWTNEIIREVKESSLTVSDEGKDSFIKPIQYELPDGKIFELREEKVSIVEKLFNQKKSIPGFNGIHLMVVDAINKGDIDIKKEMFSNIFLCGGNTLFPNFADKLQRHIINSAPQNVRVKVICHPTPSEKRFSTWIGGSILSSLGNFHQMWFSKQEYEEHGAILIERKCA